MKKKLNLLTISAALLLGLTACGGPQPAASSSAPASDASSAPASEAPSTPASEAPSTPAVDYPALAEAGYQQISATYDDWAKGITTDQTIYLEVTVEGVKFTVSYTVAEAAKNYLKVEGNKLVVTTDKEDHLFAKAVKVNVGIGELVYYSHELNVKVLGVSLLKIADIWDLKDGDAVTTRGKVTALYGTSFFMQDGATGTEVYSSKDTGVKVGDYVETVGVISIYNGLVEVKPDTVTVLENDGGVEEPVNIELGAQTDISAAKLVGGRIFSATDLYVKEISLGHSSSSNYDYIQGTVIADGKDGTKKLTLRIEDRYAGKEMMESWGVSYDAEGKATLGDKIHAGDLITLNGILNWYNAPQISLGTVTKVTAGEAPADPVDISATFAEVLTAGKALTSGESSYDYYVFDAYVVKNTGTNYFLGATADADTSDDKALFEIYKASEANQAKLLKGAKVTVKTKIKNFNGQVEDAGDATLTITVVEAGEAWVVNYNEVTVAQAIAAALALEDGKTSTELYKVSGYIVAVTYAWGNGTASLTLGATKDATDVLTVYKLAVPEADKDKVVVGAQLTIGGNLQNYVKDNVHTPEFVNGKVLEWGEIPEVPPTPVVNYGTLEAPLSVADVLGNDGTLCAKTQAAFSAEKVFVKGVLKSATYNSSYQTWTLELADSKDSADVIKATGLTLAAEVAANLAPNDTVIVKHWVEFFNNAYSLYYKKSGDVYDYGEVLSRTVGTSVLTAEAEHATVTGLAESYQNDAEASFTVAPAEGYEIVKVKVYEKEVDAVEGVYKVTVAGDSKVEVETKEAGAALPDPEVPAYDGYAPVATYSFGADNGTSELSSDALKAVFAKSYPTAKGISDIVTTVSDVSKVYGGYSSFESLGLKFGTGSANGTFTLGLSQNVDRVVVSAIGWGTSDKLMVGDAEAQTLHGKYNDAGAVLKDYVFDVTSTNELVFTMAKRGFIQSVTFYAEEGAE